jgi:5'-nucleotidase
MSPYIIINKASFDILFTGIITEKVMDTISMDRDVGSFITLQEACAEVGKITNAYKNDDIDLTILLTHIGFDSDKELAAMLNPEWGVDLIIGGHSHTILDKPEKVNGIYIAQAGVGTDQVGRFDVIVDDDTNSIVEYKWQLIPIDDDIADPDLKLQKYIDSFKEVVDRKYNTIICKLGEMLTHPLREEETSLGNLIADAFAQCANADVMFLGSGSVRVKELGPLVTLSNFISCFPYNDTLNRFTITGEQLKRVFSHIMRPDNRSGEGECYQVNRGVKAVYNDSLKQLQSLSINEEPVSDSGTYTICMQGYHYSNSAEYLNIAGEELARIEKPRIVSTSAQEVLEEFLRNNQNIISRVEGRLIYI